MSAAPVSVFAGFSAEPQAVRARISFRHQLLLGLLWINVAISGYVVQEPAPYDIAILIVFALAVGTQAIQVSRQVLVAGSVLLLFLILSSLLTASPMDWDRWLRFSGATGLLALSWLLFASVTHRFGPRGANIILGAYAFAAVLGAIAALLGYFELIANLRPLVVSWNRTRSFFKDPNVFGPFLLAPTLVCGMWIQAPSATFLKRALAAAAGTVLLVAAFFSYSRASYVTTLFAIIFYAVLTGVLRSWRSFVVLFMATGGVWLLLSLVPNVGDVLHERLESHNYDQDRFQVFDLALGLGSSHLLGVGSGQSNEILGYGVHSMYIRLFADHGALGLSVFLVFLGACVARMVAQVRRARDPEGRRLAALILAATAGTLLNGMVIETIHWRHLWLLLGLCWYAFPERAADGARGGVSQ